MRTGKKTVMFFAILLLLVLSFEIANVYLRAEEPLKVDFRERSKYIGTISDSATVRIAVAAILSPEETSQFYQDMFDYVSARIDAPVELVQRRTYQEVNDLVRRNSVDVAFVCSLAYVEGHQQFGMELLAVPVVKGAPVYYSYIIVPKDSPATSLQDLKGKVFAYSDPLSNSGKLSPDYLLTKMGYNPLNFFGMTFFTYSHDKSIQAVAEKMVDGAAVDSLVWDYKNATNPQFTSKTKIISKSPPYGIPPVVVSKDVDPVLKEKIRKVFLEMHEDAEGQAILKRLSIDGFVQADDQKYDSIREMNSVVKDAIEGSKPNQ
ncbi:MAG: phosphate/phosphite/phosphonate ABC transporter substrate-binding protein [Thaumarchaeota archaeon]|nr:phosphate/phosphite/phosphonate ABC transporter substrate-binding protein [Nitrososphaerota archaeon]